jgi:peptide/nickel transport system substrate-binding protein
MVIMDSQQNAPEQKETSSNPFTSPPEKKRFRKKPIIISILAILIIAAVSFGVLWYLKNTQTKSTVKDESSKDIKELTIATPDGPLNGFFPETDYIFYDFTFHLNAQLAEGLVGYEDMTKIVPRLATSWKNPDENTWVFNLKKDVKFHTGRTMTADDVVYSINRTKEDDMVQNYSIYNGTISSVKALSKYEVEIKTDKPDAVLLNKLSMVYIVDGENKANTATGGTGPYIIKPGTKPSEDKLDLVAFDDYHDGRPQVRSLDFRLVESEVEAVKAVRDGKANIAGELTTEGVKGVDKDKIDLRKLSSNAILYVIFNSMNDSSSPLSKKDVRQAIRSALNMDEIIKGAAPDTSPASQIVPQDIPGYNPDVKVSKQDIEKAKQLLTDAGYPNGFKINFTYISAHTDMVNILENQLSKVNITLDRVEIPLNDYTIYQNMLEEGKAGLSIIGYSSDTLDALEAYEGLFNQVSKVKGDERLDKYMSQASGEFDAKKRLEILQNLAVYTDEQSLMAPMIQRVYYWVTDNTSYVLPRDMSNSGTGTYYWKAHLK